MNDILPNIHELSLDNEKSDNIFKYYDDKRYMFNPITLDHNIFNNYTYEEISMMDDHITVVMHGVSCPPTLYISNISFLKRKENNPHRRLVALTPNNCNFVTTKLVLIVDPYYFDLYKETYI